MTTMSAITYASQTADARPTFRRPKIVLPLPTPASKFQKTQPGVPDTQLTREATGLVHEFSTPLLFNHSHRVCFWGPREMFRQVRPRGCYPSLRCLDKLS